MSSWFSAARRSSASRRGIRGFVQLERQALGRTPGLQELRQVDLLHRESRQHQPGFQRFRRLVQEHLVADVDGIAGEVSGVHRVHHDALVGRDAALDGDPLDVVERRRVIHQEAAGERAEARIDVVEARVGQPDRHHLDAEELLDLGMRLDFGTETVARPEARRAAIQQAVACALEADLLVEVEELETVLPEPLLEVRLLGTPLVRHEMAGDRLVAVHDARVRGEHHVRQVGLGIDRDDVGVLGERVAQGLPLLPCEILVQGTLVPRHPRVDDVLHLEVIGRAHQYPVPELLHRELAYAVGRRIRASMQRTLPPAEASITSIGAATTTPLAHSRSCCSLPRASSASGARATILPPELERSSSMLPANASSWSYESSITSWPVSSRRRSTAVRWSSRRIDSAQMTASASPTFISTFV